ncbi:Ig-like domain-containing protein [Kordia sp.]|uniref:Ig-like domain-containing protein n=1 Tax=Kordia sp. TaxID=1965332 RepID=UPI0025BD4064|nr:Ig-like domain-containing protein [Kordia sp.]MCH2194154.1 Ig-like domain-containing protein [Kordia sp.]
MRKSVYFTTKTIMRNTTVFILFCVFLSFFSCNTGNPEADNIFEFKDYIYQTTAGTVSVKEPIIIGLQKQLPNVGDSGEISADLISISPKVAGKLLVQNNKTLRFEPDAPLQPDTEYSVTVNLKDIYEDVKKEFSTYTFVFKTVTPNFSVTTNDLQSYSKDWQYLNGTLRAADFIPAEKLSELISATQNGKTLNIKWEPSVLNNTTYEFTIDSINRLDNNSEVKISWTGTPILSKAKGGTYYTIPGKNNFSIIDVKVSQSPEQKVSINFTDPLVKNQNFAGLVTIKDQKNITYAVDGNILNVYPKNRIKGITMIEVFPGIKSKDDYKLKINYRKRISFEQQKPQLQEVSKGIILPNSKNLTYNLQAMNLKAVDVRIIKIYQDNVLQFLQENSLNEIDRYNIKRVGRRIAKKTINLIENDGENDGQWKTYGIDLSTLFSAEPGAIYQVEIGFKRAYSLYTCEEGDTKTNHRPSSRGGYYQNREDEDENEKNTGTTKFMALETIVTIGMIVKIHVQNRIIYKIVS